MRRPLIAAAAASLIALGAPGLAAAQSQNPIGQTLENLGRALGGQGGGDSAGVDRQDRRARDDAFDRAYRDNSREFARYDDAELRRVDRQLSQAWVELQAASKALDDEMQRRASGSSSGSRFDDRGSGGSDDRRRR